MKILMVNKFLYPNGGSETYIFELGKELIRQEHEVQYFGMEHPDRIVGNNVGAYTSNMDFHGGNKLAKLLAPLKIVYSFEARRQIRKVLDDFKPDVVHLNNINFQITPSIIYEIRSWEKKQKRDADYKGCKIVFTAHDYQWICPNHMLYIPQRGEVCERCKGGRYIECTKNNCIHGSKVRSLIGTIEAYYYKWRKTYGMVDTIICPSRFLFDKYAEDPILRDKLVMMHNFIIANTLEVPEKKNDDKYVLYFGRYDVQKGIKTLIAVCKSLPDVQFIFAGSGPLENELCGIPNIKNVGFKTGAELRELIANAAFSVYPSEWYENCPFSVMESQMYGTPVIGANIGGIPELIIHDDKLNVTGQVFESGDVQGLRSCILNMYNNENVLQTMIANCRSCNYYISIDEYLNYMLNSIYL